MKKLRREYCQPLQWLQIACLTGGIILWLFFGDWLAHAFGLPVNKPLKGLSHGNVFIVLCVTSCVGSLVVSHWASFAVLAALLRWRAGWSVPRIRHLLFDGEVPSHWLKPLDAAGLPLNGSDGLERTIVPMALTVCAATLLPAAGGYACYVFSRHLSLPHPLVAFGVTAFFSPTILALAIWDSVQYGLSVARIYCALVALCGCWFIGLLVYRILSHAS